MNILVVSLSNIGDVVLTTPVIMNLVEQRPDARITLVVGPKAESLVRGSRHIERLVIYNKKGRWLEQLRFLCALRETYYDLVVDLRNTAIPLLVSCGRTSPLIRRLKETSMRARHLEVLSLSDMQALQDPEPFDFFNEEEARCAFEKVHKTGVDSDRWILIAAGAASARKRWPLENYREVLSALLAERPEPVLLIGDKSEHDHAAPLTGLDPKRVINAAGLTTLRESAALIARGSLLLTNDSAAMHLGHELRRPVVAVFGPTDPAKYGREGGSFRLIRPTNPEISPYSDSFGDVTPAAVLAACRELLSLPDTVPS